MKIKALCSFAGAISMVKNEVKDCDASLVVNDLLSCGYVEVVETPPLESIELEKSEPEESEQVKPEPKKKPRKRTVKADENK